MLLLVGLSACGGKFFSASQSPTSIPGAIYVDATKRLGTINPLAYGANHGPWAFVNYDLWDEVEAAGITFLRFPGGNWGDENNLRASHLEDFVALSRRIGAEPQISVRLQGGTPEQAAEIVRYTNLEQGYNIKYWSIGNEPELYQSDSGFEDYDTARYNREWRSIAEAMRAVDPNILLLGPEITQYTANPESDPRDGNGIDWMRAFLEANGDYVDLVSFHRYPFPASMTAGPASPAELLANSQEWALIIPSLRTLILETTGRDLPIAVTEINSYWTNVSGGETTPDSFYSALWWADVLGHLIRQKVEIVAYFSLQSNPSTGGYGLVSRREVRPTYYVYKLYQQFGTELVHSSSEDPDISVYAALREEGTLTILAVNRGSSRVEKTLQSYYPNQGETARVWLFDADHAAEEVDSLPWSEQSIVSLPAYSATMFVIQPETIP